MKVKLIIFFISFFFINNIILSSNNYIISKGSIIYEDRELKKKKEVLSNEYKCIIQSYNLPGFFYNNQFGTSLYIKYNNNDNIINK